MEQEKRKRYISAAYHIVLVLLFTMAAILFLPRITVFLFPLLIGWCIACIANPIVRFLEKRLKIKRKQGSALVILTVIIFILLLLYFILTFLLKESLQLLDDVSQIWTDISTNAYQIKKISVMGKFLPENVQGFIMECITDADGFINNIFQVIQKGTLSYIGNIAARMPDIFINIILCILFIYFCTADFEYLPGILKKKIPSFIQLKWNIVMRGFHDALGGYIKAQLKIEMWIFLLLTIGFNIIGIKSAILIALLVSVMDFLPVLGTGTVLIPWSVMELMSRNCIKAGGLLILWLASLVIRQIIQPKIIGDTVGLGPIPTVILLFCGYRLAGICGMILSVPAGIVALFLYKEGMFDDIITDCGILIRGLSGTIGIEKNGKADKKENNIRDNESM